MEYNSSGSCALDEMKPVTFIQRSVLLSELHLSFCMFRYVWKVSEWSECSSPCNGGKQNRTLECRGVLVDVQVNSSLCSGEKPETEQVCNVNPCPAEWIVGNWSQVRSPIKMGHIPDISKSKYLEKLIKINQNSSLLLWPFGHCALPGNKDFSMYSFFRIHRYLPPPPPPKKKNGERETRPKTLRIKSLYMKP